MKKPLVVLMSICAMLIGTSAASAGEGTGHYFGPAPCSDSNSWLGNIDPNSPHTMYYTANTHCTGATVSSAQVVMHLQMRNDVIQPDWCSCIPAWRDTGTANFAGNVGGTEELSGSFDVNEPTGEGVWEFRVKETATVTLPDNSTSKHSFYSTAVDITY